MMTYGMVHIDVDQPSHTSVVRECHLYHRHQCWQLASAHVCSVYDSTYIGDNRSPQPALLIVIARQLCLVRPSHRLTGLLAMAIRSTVSLVSVIGNR